MTLRLTLLVCLLVSLSGFAHTQTVVEFWHSQGTTQATVQALADAFNALQSEVVVVPQYTGGYQESSLRLVGAIGTGNEPVLFDAEGTVLARLVEDNALHDLADLTAALPNDLVSDIYPVLWAYGDFSGRRFGLPWNLSMPVLFYNASVFRQFGLSAPQTWEEFESAATRLTTRNTRGYLDVAAAFIFETMVSTRGGSLVSEDGQPNFDSPEALDALQMLRRISERGNSVFRTFNQLDTALVDFARTKVMMAIASQAFFPEGDRFSVAFDVAAAPIPDGTARAVPVIGAQLVVLNSASEAERQGALAFWEFLMEPENIRRWVEVSYYLPVRRAAVPLLEGWYTADPSRRASLEQLDNGILRPRTGGYVLWQGYLEEALEQAILGRTPPEVALAEAQRRALESPR